MNIAKLISREKTQRMCARDRERKREREQPKLVLFNNCKYEYDSRIDGRKEMEKAERELISNRVKGSGNVKCE